MSFVSQEIGRTVSGNSLHFLLFASKQNTRSRRRNSLSRLGPIALINSRLSDDAGSEAIDQKFLFLFDFRPALMYKFRGRARRFKPPKADGHPAVSFPDKATVKLRRARAPRLSG